MVRRHVTIRVSGRVQGVFYRAAAKEQADKLGITGLARNEPGGAVLIEAEGSNEALVAFISWCKTGSDLAEVREVTVQGGELKNYETFEIQ